MRWIGCACLWSAAVLSTAAETKLKLPSAAGWQAAAPRDAVAPQFFFVEGGRDGKGSLVLQADDREGLDGSWNRTFPITGGKHYRFAAYRKTSGVALPRMAALAKITWLDEKGRRAPYDFPTASPYKTRGPSTHQPELPGDGPTDEAGWTLVSGTYRAPSKATQAAVELHLQWAPGGKIEWSEISLTEASPPGPRMVRLATIHYRPQAGKTSEDNCRQFAPMIEEAARQRADLVVLGEVLTMVNRRPPVEPADVAETIPGPSTQYFAELAKKHNLYLVPCLYERAGNLIYNTAVLLGPEGMVGKYRKVCLPRDEVPDGVAPGNEYPAFATRFGKVGMMICYDGFFPEVARGLANAGAEVIAFPVWGCNPELVKARALENQVYVVSSTYTDPQLGWMFSGVVDPRGKLLAKAEQWGTVVVAEVDLNKPYLWDSLGDHKAHIYRHRPPVIEGNEGGSPKP